MLRRPLVKGIWVLSAAQHWKRVVDPARQLYGVTKEKGVHGEPAYVDPLPKDVYLL